MKFDKLIKSELDKIIENANFTDDELAIFRLLSKGKSLTQVSYTLNISIPTISRRIANIKDKIKRLEV